MFEGRDSRRHHDVALWKLLGIAGVRWPLARQRLSSIQSVVQFAGFPRSGHSLIGSILDAHPQARLSHELDTVGLLQNGFRRGSILTLIDQKSTEFTRHGRYWNGFCYKVPGGYHESAANLRVIGDKKGDAAVRRIARDPALLDQLNAMFDGINRWILVVRNPFDNIATMSLRQGREYDKLRIRAGNDQDFRREMEQQQGETIVDEVQDAMIDDYSALCETVDRMKQKTPSERWFELCYERFVANPQTSIGEILAFLDLPLEDDYLNNCASLVNPTVNESRHHIRWSDGQVERVNELIERFSFLRRYESSNGE